MPSSAFHSSGRWIACIAFLCIAMFAWLTRNEVAPESELDRTGTVSAPSPGMENGGAGAAKETGIPPQPEENAVHWRDGALATRILSDAEWEEVRDAHGLSLESDRPHILEKTPLEIDWHIVEAARDRTVSELAFDLGQGAPVVVQIENVVNRGKGVYTLQGRIGDEGITDFTLSVYEDAVAGRFISPKTGIREIRHLGGGVHETHGIDDSLAPVCVEDHEGVVGPPAREPSAPSDSVDDPDGEFSPSDSSELAAIGDAETVLDVMVVYSSTARAGEGGTNGILALINQGVDDTNIAFQNSNIDAELRLVHTEEVVYSGSSDGQAALNAIYLKTDGLIDGIHATRDEVGADFVAFLHEITGTCGVGKVPSVLSQSQEYRAFTVTDPDCYYQYTFTHELGHNFGFKHAVGDGTSGTPRGGGLFDWSHGWRWGSNQYRSVMAYSPGTRVRHYSNPRVTYGGLATGRENLEDNARSMEDSRAVFATYRDAVLFDDHGDSPDDATPVTLDSTTPGVLETSGDHDFFAFTLTEATEVRLESTGDTDTWCVLTRSGGISVGSAGSGGEGLNFRIEMSLTAGTYYAEVGGLAGTTGSYNIDLSETKDDHGDTRTSASYLLRDWYETGVLDDTSDIDYFRIGLASPGTLTVYAEGAADTEGQLETFGGTPIATDGNSGPGDAFSMTAALAPGTYFVRVTGLSAGVYTVHSSFTPIVDDHGNSGDDATATTLGTPENPSSIDGVIQYRGDDEAFSFTVPGDAGTGAGSSVTLGLEGYSEGRRSELKEAGYSVTGRTEGMEFLYFPASSSSTNPEFPDNGTSIIRTYSSQFPQVQREDGSEFDVLSVDVAEYRSNFASPQTMSWIGTKSDGSTVSHTFVTDGIIDGTGPLADFETVNFPATFSNLVKFTYDFAPLNTDNIRVRASGPEAPEGTLGITSSKRSRATGRLMNSAGDILETALSDIDGNFLIDRLITPGNYLLVVEKQFIGSNVDYGLAFSYEPPDLNPPDPPTDLSATAQPDDSFALAWTESENATHYRVYRSEIDDFLTATSISGQVSVSTFVDGSIVAGSDYFYWVTAISTHGESSPGESATARIEPRLPTFTTVPDEVRVISGNGIVLSAEAASNTGSVTYSWFAGESGDTSTPISSTDSSATLNNLLANGSYWVRAENSAGSVDSGTFTVVVTTAAPAGVKATDGLLPNSVRLYWESVDDAASYRIYKGTSNSFALADFLGSTSETHYVEEDVATGAGSHNYFVLAVDGDGDRGPERRVTGRNAAGPLSGVEIEVDDMEDFVFDDVSAKLYFTTSPGFVDEYDLAQRMVTRSFHIGGAPKGLDISPDGTRLWVADSAQTAAPGQGRIAVVDLSTGTVSSDFFSLSPGEEGAFDIVAMSPTKAFVTAYSDGPGNPTVSFREYDPVTGNFMLRNGRGSSNGGGTSVGSHTGFDRNTARSHALVIEKDSIAEYDTATDTFSDRSPGTTKNGAASRIGDSFARGSGGNVAVIHEASPTKYLHRDNRGFEFSPYLDELYVVTHNPDRLRGYDAATMLEIFFHPVSGGVSSVVSQTPLGDVEISPDGKTVAAGTISGIALIDTTERVSPPDSPSRPTAVIYPGGRADLDWSDLPRAESYNVHRSDTSGELGDLVVEGIEESLWTDENLVSGTHSYYSIVAVNRFGASLPSPQGYLGYIATPTGLVAESGDDAVFLSCDSIDVSVTYQLYRGSTPDPAAADPIRLITDPYEYVDRSVPYNMDHYYHVRAKSGTLLSPPSNVVSARRLYPAPGEVEVSIEEYEEKVLLVWDSVGGAHSYRIYRTLEDGTGETMVAEVTDSFERYEDRTADPGVVYHYAVSTVGSDGIEGARSGALPGLRADRFIFLPDATIAGLGSGVINGSGGGQTILMKMKAKRPASVGANVVNRGLRTDTIRVVGTSGVKPYEAAYFHHGANITAGVVTGRFTVRIDPGGAAPVVAQLRAKAKKGKKIKPDVFILSFYSGGSPGRGDTVGIRTNVKTKKKRKKR